MGTLLYVIAFAADVKGVSIGTAINPGAWLALFGAGWAGKAALVRLIAVIALFYVVRRPEAINDPDTAIWAWAGPLLGVLAMSMSRVAGPMAPIGVLVEIAHILAVAVWFGGAAFVALVVLSGPGEADLVRATRTFAKISVPALVVAVVTGVIEMIRLDGADLFASGHGRMVLIKVVVVAGMIFVALASRQQITARLQRARVVTPSAAERFGRSFRVEAGIGLVVLLLSGWMVGMNPSKVDPFAGEKYLPTMAVNDVASGFQARIHIGPGKAGPTGLKVEVISPQQGLNKLVLTFVPPPNSGAFAVEQSIDLTGAGTAYLDDSDGLPLSVPGEWTLQVSAVTTTGVLNGAAHTFQLTDDKGATVTYAPATVPPTVQVAVVNNSTTVAPLVTTPPSNG